MKRPAVVYVGEFDLRNENVQAHLVKNNGKILRQLGYEVFFVGTNRNCDSFDAVNRLSIIPLFENKYLELPHTLTFGGLLKIGKIEKTIINFLNHLRKQYQVSFIITYQAPTYACVLNSISKWCDMNQAAYIVNCADLPVFDSQIFPRKVVMNLNWDYMHYINKKRADGVIAVSKYIEKFYRREGRPSVIIPPLFDEPKLLNTAVKPNNVPTFIYAGTPFVMTGQEVNTKGMKDRLDKIIDVMIRLELNGTKFSFQIVGISLEDYSTCVPKHRIDLKNSKCITFFGRKSHKETLEFLQRADYMINYRDKNLMTEAGMSTKVVESVSVGTPVIMNDIGDTFLYLEEGISGIKLSGQFEEDVKILKKVCSLSVDDRVATKIRVKNSGIFSLEKYKQKLSNFLKAVEEK